MIRIEGTVTNQATGAPIAGARVQLDWEDVLNAIGWQNSVAVASTNGEGRYTLSYHRADCRDPGIAGLNRLSASGAGYSDSYEGSILCKKDIQRFDFRLAPG